MAYHPFSVSAPHVVYACLGGFVVLFGMFSLFIREKLYIGEACWAFLFGVIIGPYGANVFNPRGWGGGSEVTTNVITLEFTRVVLAIGVFAIGVELPKAYMARHWKSLFFLLVPVMTWGWFVSAGLIFALIPGLNFLSSLVVAACLTPTDPILAAAVVGGRYADKHVPSHLRHLLAAESGCNDGAAFPFLYIALFLIKDSPSVRNAIRDWILQLWLYQVIMGVVIGSLLGFGFRHLMKFCERNDLIDRQSYVAQYVSLAALTIGVCTLLGSDDLLAAFSCGTAFAWDGFFNRQTEQSVFSSVIDLLFNVAAFVFVGAWMPFHTFNSEALTLSVWRLIVIAILVLLLKRLPVMIALYRWIPDVKTFREAVFSGHFGPIGIGAIFISTLAAGLLPKPSNPPANQQELLAATVQPIVSFMVLCSITIHGLSIPFFSLGRRVHSVSRTWSRQTSLPEWMNQAQHIERGADIVMNRDGNLERGDLPPDEKLAIVSRKARDPNDPTASYGRMPIEGFPAGDQRPEGSDTDAESPESQAAAQKKAGEYPPDGTDIIQEWREGPHKVVEQRRGPGEEMEVEVIRNFYESENGQGPSSVRSAVTHNVAESVDRLRDAPKAVEEGAEKLEDGARRAGQNIWQAAKEAEHSTEDTVSPTSGHNSDEEEGWASDNGDDRFASVSTTSSSGEPAHSKSKRRLPRLSISSRQGRRRNLMRRSILSHQYDTPNPTPQPSEPPSDAEDMHRRGRTSTYDSLQSSRSGSVTAPRSRVVSLRTPEARSRDQSPARSVRFVESGHRSGVSTPRTALGHMSESFTSMNHAGSGLDGQDSFRGRVTFDLPTPK